MFRINFFSTAFLFGSHYFKILEQFSQFNEKHILCSHLYQLYTNTAHIKPFLWCLLYRICMCVCVCRMKDRQQSMTAELFLVLLSFSDGYQYVFNLVTLGISVLKKIGIIKKSNLYTFTQEKAKYYS